MNKWHPILALIGIVLILLGSYMTFKQYSTGPAVSALGYVVDNPFVQGWAYKYPGLDKVYIFDGGTLHPVANPEAYARWYKKPYRGLPLDQYAPVHPMPDGAYKVGQGGPIN